MERHGKKDLLFSYRRERIKEREPIALEPGTLFERVISPAEQIRFEENNRFAEVIYDRMIDLIDGNIKMQDLEKELSETKKNLSLPQQEVMEKIVANLFKKAEGKVCKQGTTLSSLYKKRPLFAPYDLFINYVKSRSGVSLSGKISMKDISVTPWGAVVVKIFDENIWKEVLEKGTDLDSSASDDYDGFKINSMLLPLLEREESESYSEEKDHRYIEEQANRTVCVYTGGKSEEEILKITRHELFHDIYDNVISSVFESAFQSRYKNEEMNDVFRMVKNEMVAYALANRLQTYEEQYFPTSYRKSGSLFKDLKQLIILSILKENLPEEEGGEVDICKLEEKIEKYESHFGEGKFKEAEKDATVFIREMGNVFREIARLKIIDSNAFEKVAKISLTAQSFNEMSYKLSLIDFDRAIDAVEIVTENSRINLERVAVIIEDSIYFRIPIANLDNLVLRIQEELSANKEISENIKKRCERAIKYYQENTDRWLKPREQRK